MSWFINFVLYIWELLRLWFSTIFLTPFQNADMLWILVPVWLGWFFAEFFQEKTGTSMGNAMSNAVIVLWGSIDWFRQTVGLMSERVITGFWSIAPRFFLAAVVLGYGLLIIILGVKGKKVIQYIGRIREVTYVFAMFTPIFYNTIPFSFEHILATVLFFPLFYYVIELIDRYTPNPRALLEDASSGNRGMGMMRR
jgi:hypothetical protein